MKDKDLETRKKRVLEAVIRLYVKEMAPVGSSYLVNKYNFRWSPATVRNIMAQLENEGLLKQPHTSAGRIPTDRGYRYYVDNIMNPRKASLEERVSIKRQYDFEKTENLDKLIKKTTRVICAITNQAALMMMPGVASGVFERIKFVRFDENKLLVVLLNSSGIIKNVIINLPKGIAGQELEKIENLLNSELKGSSLNLIRNYLLNKIKRHQDAVFNIINNAYEIIDLIDWTEDINNKLFLDGLSLIMDKPEFKDIDKTRGILHVLEEKTEILEIMDRDLEGFKKNIRVHIGTENIYEDIRDCSLITSKYRIGNQAVGSLGVIGPTRMDYDEIVSMLECVSEILSDILSETDYIEE